MELRALGPVMLADRGAVLDIEVAKHRALLAVLALRGDRIASNADLVEALWGDNPPATAIKTLQGYVSQLRRRFGHELIQTVPGGYRLGAAVDEIDVTEFERSIASGRARLRQLEPAAARRHFRSALRYWTGQPLQDLADGTVRAGQTARLHELRLLAEEGLIEAELALGHHREVVPDLDRLVAKYPSRELLWRGLMLALYRSGRTADALQTYRRLRTTLVEEFGLDPSTETQQLEHRILDQDPSLDLPAATPPTNLPALLDSFVGRAAELRSVIASLDAHPFVTLLGVGGVGKSRLANEVGRTLLDDTAGGVWWIDLATEDEGASFAGLAAAAMELDVSPAGSVETVLLTRLRRAPTLLILDNCEHLGSAARDFVEWVTANAPLAHVLATSRSPLDVPGGRRIVVEPLATDNGTDSDLSDAATLFVDRLEERTQAGSLDRTATDAIVGTVAGLPLGVELAAAQCVTTTPRDLSRALRDRDVLLSMTDLERDDDRHVTLRRVLDVSLEAIEPPLAAQLALLATFAGDFDASAAAAVLGVPRLEAEGAITQLLTVSLLSASPRDGAHRRFRLLAPIRELMIGRLSTKDRHESQQRHARHFHALARSFLHAADTPAEHEPLERVSTDRHNVAAALEWFEEHDPAGALVFGPALGLDRQLRGNQHEARDLLRRLLRTARRAPDSDVAWVEEFLTWPEFLSGDIDDAIARNADAIARFEAASDPRGLSRALRTRAHASHLSGIDEATTTPIYQRAIEVARSAHLPYSMALSQVQFAHALTVSEQFDVVDVSAMLSEAEQTILPHGDHALLAHICLSRGLLAFSQNDIVAERVAGEAMLRHSRLARAPMWEQTAMAMLAVVAHQEGNAVECRHWIHDSVHLAHDTDNRTQLGVALHALAAVSAASSPELAARTWGLAGTLSPPWPLFERRYGEWLSDARNTLGARFDELVAEGELLTVDDAVLLAESIT